MTHVLQPASAADVISGATLCSGVAPYPPLKIREALPSHTGRLMMAYVVKLEALLPHNELFRVPQRATWHEKEARWYRGKDPLVITREHDAVAADGAA